MFGSEIWQHTIVVFTRLSMNTRTVRKRKKANKDTTDEELAEKYLAEVENHFPHSRGMGLSYLIMDAHYVVDDEDYGDDSGALAFQKAMDILWEKINHSAGMSTEKVKLVESENKKLRDKIKEIELKLRPTFIGSVVGGAAGAGACG